MKIKELKEQILKAPGNIKLILKDNINDDLIIYNDNKICTNYFQLKDVHIEIIGNDYYYLCNLEQINKVLKAKKINFQINFVNEVNEFQTKKEFTILIKDYLKSESIINNLLDKKDYDNLIKNLINTYWSNYHENSFERLMKLQNEANYNIFTVVCHKLATDIKIKFLTIKDNYEVKNILDKIKVSLDFQVLTDITLLESNLLNDLSIINKDYFVKFIDFYYKIYQYFYYDYELINIDTITSLINNFYESLEAPEPAPINEVKNEVSKPEPIYNNLQLAPPPAPINEVKLLPPAQINEVTEVVPGVVESPINDNYQKYIDILNQYQKYDKPKIRECDFCTNKAQYLAYFETVKLYCCESCIIKIELKEEMF